jgi:hypothetical protein
LLGPCCSSRLPSQRDEQHRPKQKTRDKRERANEMSNTDPNKKPGIRERGQTGWATPTQTKQNGIRERERNRANKTSNTDRKKQG